MRTHSETIRAVQQLYTAVKSTSGAAACIKNEALNETRLSDGPMVPINFNVFDTIDDNPTTQELEIEIEAPAVVFAD